MATREDILKAAAKIVSGQRKLEYGKSEDSFGSIADLWGAYMHAKFDVYLPISTVDVALMMILLKIARCCGGQGKLDNWVDIAGYAACGGEIESRYIDCEKTDAPYSKEDK